MHVKKDDKVIILTGQDKGKTGKILKAFPAESTVLVEGINKKKKHIRASRGGKGSLVEKEHPVHVSNVKKA